MEIYKHGGFSVHSPKEVKLNRDTIGILSKLKDGRIHMDFAEKGKGPDGSSLEFPAEFFSEVLGWFK
jgi:hypothetical protein